MLPTAMTSASEKRPIAQSLTHHLAILVAIRIFSYEDFMPAFCLQSAMLRSRYLYDYFIGKLFRKQNHFTYRKVAVQTVSVTGRI